MNAMVMEKLDQLFRVISRFALLNILWLSFTIFGLVVVGLFPATVAMFSVARKWVQGEEDVSVIKSFWAFFKVNFVKANIYGWICALVGFILYLNYQVMITSSTEVPLVVVISFLLLVLIYLLLIVSVIPVSIHFEGNGRDILRKTSMFIIGRIHIALLFLLIVWTVSYMSLAFPTVILFFSGSVLSYMLMWFFIRTLEKLEQKQIQQRLT